ncbi:MAG: outer membrane lipoprotein carrier protein LolA [Spirochaetota bacterium]|nr:outer membrane lipoprotein carrier protein LolA [Spirochaetota bacterium]
MTIKKLLLAKFLVFILLSNIYAGDQIKLYINKYKNIQSFKAKFIQKKRLSVLKNEQLSYGQIKFKKKDKVLWELEKPYSYKFILNGKKIYKIYPQLMEKEEYNLDENKQFKILFDNIFLLMGQKSLGEIKKNYNVTSGDKWIKLIPRPKNYKKYMSYILLKFNDKDLIKSIKLAEPKGDYTFITFYDIELNKDIKDSMFSSD